MTKKYNQLNLEQRYKIEAYIQLGKSQTEIAFQIGVHKSTICREMKRNIPQRGFGAKIYVANNAQVKTNKRHFAKPKHTSFNLVLKNQMEDWLINKRFSPELVSEEWKRQNIKGVSLECIYQYIWHCKHSNKLINKSHKNLYKLLKHSKRRRKRGNYKDSRGLILNRISIEKRPKIVNERKRYGDLEVDLIMGKNHKSALLVTVDRCTLMTTIDKLEGKNASYICNKIIHRMKKFMQIKTMTFDNDLAFCHHQKIANALNIKTYFTRPYTSQDKGTIENRNGLIRMFFPKKTDFNEIAKTEIKRVEKEINNRPIRKFGYKTPNEVYLQLKVSVALMS